MHEDDPARGGALGARRAPRATSTLLRDLGANMTRAHYPLHPLTLELADRYGIVVWSEVPVYQMRDALFRRAARAPAAPIGMVRDDGEPRPQPSVGDRVEPRQREHVEAGPPASRATSRRRTRSCGSSTRTRLVGLAFPGYPTVGKAGALHEARRARRERLLRLVPGPGRARSPTAARSAPYLERLHGDYPRQALFVTEFGAEANRPGPSPRRARTRSSSDFLTYHLDVFGQKPYLNGALVWILRDFRVKPGYDGGNPQARPAPTTRRGWWTPPARASRRSKR